MTRGHRLISNEETQEIIPTDINSSICKYVSHTYKKKFNNKQIKVQHYF